MDIQESLLFLHVEELRDLSILLSLDPKGTKKDLVFCITHYLATGEKWISPKIPPISRAVKGVFYPLEENTVMLKGSYKNDLKTRLYQNLLLVTEPAVELFSLNVRSM